MRGLMKPIDRFCDRHPGFGIPNLMLYIVIGNIAVWLFGIMDSSGLFKSLLYFSPYHILHGQVWRLVTFVFVSDYRGIWLLLAMYFYYFIGSTLERNWGAARFTMYYIIGVLLTVIYGFIIYFATGNSVSVSASYINLSMFFSFAALFPDQIVLLFFIIPVKIKWLAWVDAAFFAVSVVTTAFPYNLLPVVAVLNFVLFCGDELFSFIRRRPNRGQRQRAENFKREARKVSREQKANGYRHKCAVCGVTDTQRPDLEFRYCSRCQGYHCFCQDHINNHIHFTE